MTNNGVRACLRRKKCAQEYRSPANTTTTKYKGNSYTEQGVASPFQSKSSKGRIHPILLQDLPKLKPMSRGDGCQAQRLTTGRMTRPEVLLMRSLHTDEHHGRKRKRRFADKVSPTLSSMSKDKSEQYRWMKPDERRAA